MSSIPKTPVEHDEDHPRFSDETTRKKIEEHLGDINSTISDDDIRNVITDIRSDEDEMSKGTDEEADQLPTAWNISE